jgi:hypothetical protein
VERINAAVDRLTSASQKLTEAMYRASGAQPDSNGQGGSKPKDDVVDGEFVDAGPGRK